MKTNDYGTGYGASKADIRRGFLKPDSEPPRGQFDSQPMMAWLDEPECNHGFLGPRGKHAFYYSKR